MESSDLRRQSDVLPSINYSEFERQAREGAQFHQRHPSIAQNNISAASPISPTTPFGGASGPNSIYSPSAHHGIHTPPESRRTSDNNETRQSLPSLHALFEKSGSFSAPSPMQTPPIGSGSFSGPSRTNSMPRSQPTELGPSSQPPPLPTHAPHGYGPPSQPTAHGHETPYPRHDSHNTGRTLPPNPYSQAQPPPSIPAMQPPETYPPPPPPAPTHPQSSSPPFQSHSQYPPANQASSPHYPPHTPQFSNGPPLPHGPQSQYPPYPSHQVPPPPPATSQSPYPPQGPPPTHSQYPYPQVREAGYPPQPHHEPPGGPSPAPKGMKRGSGYGIAIERALSISAIRRDMDSIKENASRIYHIIHNYQEASQGGQHPGGVNGSLQDFTEALQRSQNNTEALQTCQQVFRDLSAKEYAEQNAQKVAQVHGSEYGTDESQSYDDNRSNGSQQPEQKKMRRGRAAPPGRCHSCHRAETPEWRRGPDGARTLCNACGLHYAKLTRKLSKNSIGSGPLANRKPSNSPHP